MHSSAHSKTLLVMRHAQAGWSASGDDHDRELTAAGHEQALRMGQWILEQGLRPDQIVCSDAQRTRQTCVWVCERLGEEAPTASLDSRLYGADAARALSVINETEERVGAMLVIGHMPWVQELGLRLLSVESEQSASLEMAEQMPPAGLQVFRVPGVWEELDGRDADLLRFVTPETV